MLKLVQRFSMRMQFKTTSGEKENWKITGIKAVAQKFC